MPPPDWLAIFGVDRSARGWRYACVVVVEERVTLHLYDPSGEQIQPRGFDLYGTRLLLERDGWVLVQRGPGRWYFVHRA